MGVGHRARGGTSAIQPYITIQLNCKTVQNQQTESCGCFDCSCLAAAMIAWPGGSFTFWCHQHVVHASMLQPLLSDTCNALQAAVQQTLVVLQAMLAELSSGARMRLLTSSPPSKLALFKRPEQGWTDVPEHSIFKNTSFAREFSGTSNQ
jgi:hypothetical protein